MDTVGSPIKLRNIEPKVIEGESPDELEEELGEFLDDGGERVLVGVYQVDDLAILILYAE